MNLNRIAAIVVRHYLLTLHQMERYFEIILFPTMALLLMGFLGKYISSLQSNIFLSFLVGGIILWVIFEKVNTDIGISFMFEIWERNIVNLLATPITIFEFISGLILVGLVKILFTILLVGVLASVFYDFNLTSLGFGLSLFWINLILFAWAFGLFNVSMVLRFGHTVGPLTWSIPWLLQPVSAVFYPVASLPNFLQKVAQVLPLSYVFEGMRQVLSQGSFNFDLFVKALALNVVYLSLSIGFFVWIFLQVKKSGHLVKLI